jgi:hypothetical protein
MRRGAAAVPGPTGKLATNRGAYFCHVRFLCRCWRSFLRRLCLLIFALRRFFSEPIGFFSARSIYDLVERVFNNSFGAGRFELGDQLAHDVLVDDRFHRHPAGLAEVGHRRVAEGRQALE